MLQKTAGTLVAGILYAALSDLGLGHRLIIGNQIVGLWPKKGIDPPLWGYANFSEWETSHLSYTSIPLEKD